MHVSELNASKFAFHSLFPGFKNNTISTGSFTIGGSYGPGVNTRTSSATLSVQPDLADILFKSNSIELSANYASGTPIPVSNKWVRRGSIAVPASGLLGTLYFIVAVELNGTSLTFRCYGVNQTTDTGTLTDTNVDWKLVDYSIF